PPTRARFPKTHPVGPKAPVNEGPPRRGVSEVLAPASEIELVPVVGMAECLDKLPAKDPTEDLHREEEAHVLGMDPALVIGRESARRHDAVDVGMTHQGLPPRVEDAEHANLRTEMAGVGGDLAKRRRAALKEP